MPLTPADVHNIAFKKPPIGKRGYDEEEVDAFLDEVERELARLLEENMELRSRLGSGYAGGQDGDRDQRMRAEIANLKSTIDRLMREQAAAEHNADAAQAELQQARSQRALTDGSGAHDSQAIRVLMMAQRTADDHMRDAHQEAGNLLAQAQIEAEHTLQDAQLRAETMVREAEERHQQAIESIDRQRTDLLREINGCTGLAQDYRSRLREALTNQLLEMDSTLESGRTNPPRLLGSASAE